MASGVKFIFKSLIKVPIIILAVYMVFNLFAFSFTYFRALGLSYVVMQTAVENNYLPPEELNTLQEYLDSITNTEVASNGVILLNDPDNPVDQDASIRRQYGSEVAVGVSLDYKVIWPLMPNEQKANEGESFGLRDDGSAFSGLADDGTLAARRDANEFTNNINIVYKIPGLKYYPDLQ